MPPPVWICPSCGLDHTPGDHDLALCSWQHDLARCDREIAAALQQQGVPAWLVTLGVEDWEAEKRLILQECHREGAQSLSTFESDEKIAAAGLDICGYAGKWKKAQELAELNERTDAGHWLPYWERVRLLFLEALFYGWAECDSDGVGNDRRTWTK